MNRFKMFFLIFIFWQSWAVALHPTVSSELEKLQDLITAKDLKRDESLEGQLDVVFQGVRLPLFYKLENQLLSLVLRDPKEPSNINFLSATWDTDCLFISADLKNKLAGLTLIDATPKCPIPEKKRGTFLMNLSDELIQGLGMRESDLLDSSELRCEKAKASTSLGLLSIMQKGQTWYEGFGYRSGVNIAGYNLRDIANALRLIPIKGLYPELLKAKPFIENKVAFADNPYLAEQYRTYLANFTNSMKTLNASVAAFSQARSATNIAAFLTWLWSYDCAAYIVVTDLVFPSFAVMSKEGEGAPWWYNFSLLQKFLSGIFKKSWPLKS